MIEITNTTYWGIGLVAHRGQWLNQYPNTADAFNTVPPNISIECDIQIDADGVLWCYHDTTLDTLTDGTGTVLSNTTTYLEGVRRTTGNQPLLKFVDFLSIVSTNNKKFYPEFKSGISNGEMTEAIRLVNLAGLGSRCVFQTFDFSTVAALLAADPIIKIGKLTGSTTVSVLESEIDTLIAYGSDRVEFLPSYGAFINEADALSLVARAGAIPITVWTVPSQDTLNTLRVNKVQYAMCDYNFEGEPR